MADTLAPAMVITMISLSAVSLIFLSLRMYSKYLASSKPAVDDAVLIFSWVRLLACV